MSTRKSEQDQRTHKKSATPPHDKDVKIASFEFDFDIKVKLLDKIEHPTRSFPVFSVSRFYKLFRFLFLQLSTFLLLLLLITSLITGIDITQLLEFLSI